ncbi:hypothetical protein BD779DRAFT_1549273 [Infundibulicybe gibba]|nr:hypothetical protein BD779DRAFT_1549273 [Infundibulicybe gibba]
MELPTMPRGPHSCHLGLNTLNLRWDHFALETDINSLLSSITLPSLRTLEVDFSTFRHHLDFNRTELELVLAGFFERPCTHLSVLTLTSIPFSEGGLILCLALAPSLVSLNIQFDGRPHVINNNILRRLDANHPKQILPRLHSLSLRGLAVFSEELLDALVTSRRDINPTNDGVVLLENLTLECSAPQDSLAIHPPRFHRFVPEGLKITYGERWHT